MPGQILPVAEQGGFIDEVDKWVLRRATQVMAQRQGNLETRLFVVQSEHAFADKGRADFIASLLETRQIAPELLCVEFRLERVLKQLRPAAELMNALHKLGVKLCLNRFDGSDTALKFVQRAPIEFIKMRGDSDSGRDEIGKLQKPLENIVSTVHDHDIKVIITAIEDAASAARLWTTGVDYIQGNFVQKPDQDLHFDFLESVF